MIKIQAKGFTIVEIMIAMTMGTFLMAGLIQVFQGSKKSYSLTEELSRLQENGRYAMDILARDMRMIGYQGCADPDNIVATVIANDPPTTDFSLTGLQGFKVLGSGITPALPTEFTATTITNDIGETINLATTVLENTDIIMMQYASPTGAELTGNLTPDNGNIQLVDNIAGFAADDVLMISDCQSVDIFRANSVSSGGGSVTITHSNATNTTPKLSKSYPKGAQILSFSSNLYFVGPSGRDRSASTTRKNARGDNINALYRVNINGRLEELVQGVDYMILLYGERLTNGNVRYLPADDATLNMARVDSIKIGLLMHTLEGIKIEDDTITYKVANSDIGPPGATGVDAKYENDRRLRRVFTTTVNLRNRR